MFLRILKYGFYLLFVAAFAFVSYQLFGDKFGSSVSEKVVHQSEGDLRIVSGQRPVGLDPTLNDPASRQILINVYEPLVRTDRDLKITPAIALSWGLLDDQTWEFILRPEVKFHDGREVNAGDVVASVKRAKSDKKSQYGEMLENILLVTEVTEDKVKIITKKPDPLLLQKLALVLIAPEEYREGAVNGSGPYRLAEVNKDGDVKLEAFADYWGGAPAYESVEVLSRTEKADRVNLLTKGEVDVLSAVPYEVVSALRDRGFEIASTPNLEVQFLMFNFKSELMSKKEAREAVVYALDKNSLVQEVDKNGFVNPVWQFVSDGVFGFNPVLKKNEYAAFRAKGLIERSGLAGKTVQFHLPIGLDVLGEHVRTKLTEAGFAVLVSYMLPTDFLASIQEGKADLYFLGFKSELGDAAEFFNTLVRTDADFNIANYSNDSLDEVIEQAMREMDPAARRAALQKAMRVIVNEDFVGVPLFEYDAVWAAKSGIKVNPRIDGFLYFNDIEKPKPKSKSDLKSELKKKNEN